MSEESQAALQALLNGPAVPPPPGITPNFESPPNSKAVSLIVLVPCQTIATLSVLLRLYTKLSLLQSIAWEDCKSYRFYLCTRL